MGCLHECCSEGGRDLNRNRPLAPALPLRVPPTHVSKDSGKQKKTWRHKLQGKSRGRKQAADVYYVKGSSIPVESLELNCHDSRLYYPPRQHNPSTSSGNPSLLFLMNWQIIPPLSRLAVLQRAVHCRQRSLLPVIREAPGPEGGGDSHQRSGQVTTSRQSRGLSSGDDEEDRPGSPVQPKPQSRCSPAVTSRRGQSTSAGVNAYCKSTSPCERKHGADH